MKDLLLLLGFLPAAIIPPVMIGSHAHKQKQYYFPAPETSKVRYKNDTIYKNTVPYALMTSTGGNSALAVYSVRTLLDSEIAIIKYDRSITNADGSGAMFRFTFVKSGAYGHIDAYTEQGFAEVVVNTDLIKNNRLNPDSERRFLLIYPRFERNPWPFPADTSRSR